MQPGREGYDIGFDLESITSEFGSLSLYRAEGAAESSGSDGGSADSFEQHGSVIAEDAFIAQQEDAGSTTSNRSREGLPFAIKKELVLAIEAQNGIEAVKTAKLLNDLSQYKATEVLKKQVGNKISRWKSGQRNEYESIKIAIANELQQQTHLQPRQPNSVRSNPRPPLPPRHSVVSPPRPLPQRSPPPRPSPALSSPGYSSPHSSPPTHPSPQRFLSPQSPQRFLSPQPRPFSPLPGGMNATLHAMASKAQLVSVNIDMPERNTPFHVYRFDNHELQSGKVANGFIIALQDQDPRFLLTKFFGTEIPTFEAYFIGEHEVLIKTPSTSFTFLHDEAAEAKGLTDSGVMDKPFTQPITVARNAIVRDPERQFDFWRLVFSSPLDNSVWCPDAENGNIKPVVQPVVSKYDVEVKAGTTELTSYRVNILWKVALDEALRSTKITKNRNELDTQVTSMFSTLVRLGHLKVTPHSSTAVASGGSSAVVLASTPPVDSTALVGAKRTGDDSEKNSKRPAVAAQPPSVATHPGSTEEDDETKKAIQLVEDFAQAHNISFDNVIAWLQTKGVSDWQSAVKILVDHSSDNNPADFTAMNTSTHSSGYNKAAAFAYDFKSTVDEKAAHHNHLEIQEKKRAARRHRKQTKILQSADESESVAVAVAESTAESTTETVVFDNADVPDSDALLVRDQPFSYGPYRDQRESDSDSMSSK